MKLAPEVGLGELFQNASRFCSPTFIAEVSGGVPFGASVK